VKKTAGQDGAKKLKEVQTRLERQYDRQWRNTERTPFEELVFGILNNRTTGSRASAAFEKLRQDYVDWNEIRVTNRDELAQTISGAGMEQEKAGQILDALAGIFKECHAFHLDLPLDCEESDARAYLQRITDEPFAVNSVLFYALGFNAHVVDEDVVRVAKRLGWVERHLTIDAAVKGVEELIRRRRAGALCALMARHGREVCTPRNYKCRRCPLRAVCESAS